MIANVEIEPIKVGGTYRWVVTDFRGPVEIDGERREPLIEAETVPLLKGEPSQPSSVVIEENSILFSRNNGPKFCSVFALYKWLEVALDDQGLHVVAVTHHGEVYLLHKRGGFRLKDDYHDMRSIVQSFNQGLTMTLTREDL